jgi:hypothetical protein
MFSFDYIYAKKTLPEWDCSDGLYAHKRYLESLRNTPLLFEHKHHGHKSQFYNYNDAQPKNVAQLLTTAGADSHSYWLEHSSAYFESLRLLKKEQREHYDINGCALFDGDQGGESIIEYCRYNFLSNAKAALSYNGKPIRFAFTFSTPFAIWNKTFLPPYHHGYIATAAIMAGLRVNPNLVIKGNYAVQQHKRRDIDPKDHAKIENRVHRINLVLTVTELWHILRWGHAAYMLSLNAILRTLFLLGLRTRGVFLAGVTGIISRPLTIEKSDIVLSSEINDIISRSCIEPFLSQAKRALWESQHNKEFQVGYTTILANKVPIELQKRPNYSKESYQSLDKIRVN